MANSYRASKCLGFNGSNFGAKNAPYVYIQILRKDRRVTQSQPIGLQPDPSFRSIIFNLVERTTIAFFFQPLLPQLLP
jgi:hypothetical protein